MTPNAERFECTLRAEAETIALGAALGRLARRGDCFALTGDLGAGKTRLVRGIAMGMGIDPDRVHSPTFVLANVYSPGAAGALTLAHIDAHRIRDLRELDAMGWDRLRDGGAALAIEWADRIGAALPEDRLDIALAHTGPEERLATLTAAGESWRSRLNEIRSER